MDGVKKAKKLKKKTQKAQGATCICQNGEKGVNGAAKTKIRMPPGLPGANAAPCPPIQMM
jgi:hypothetical protein